MKFRLSFLCFFLSLIISIQGSTQEVEPAGVRQTLSIAGLSTPLEYNGRTYTIQQSIGQSSPAGTLDNTNVTIRQGFIQPETKALPKKPESILEVLAYPNPFQNEITIQLNPHPTGPWKVDLYDLTGRAMYREQFILNNSAVLYLQHLTTGVYVLRATSGTLSKSIRIVKL